MKALRKVVELRQAGVEEVVDTDGTPLTSFASSFGIK